MGIAAKLGPEGSAPLPSREPTCISVLLLPGAGVDFFPSTDLTRFRQFAKFTLWLTPRPCPTPPHAPQPIPVWRRFIPCHERTRPRLVSRLTNRYFYSLIIRSRCERLADSISHFNCEEVHLDNARLRKHINFWDAPAGALDHRIATKKRRQQ